MARPIDLAKWHEWAERLERFERSGMSVCAWCRQEGIPSVQFDQVGTHNERRGFTPPGPQARLEPKNASPT